MTFNPTDNDCARILSHIRYEIGSCLLIPKKRETDWHVDESVFLPILIHARILVDFFETTTRHKDDVLCSDFGFPASKLSIKDDDRKRFNKDLAHLTYSRLGHTSATKPWPISETLRPLRERCVAFVEHVNSHPPRAAEEAELAHWRNLIRLLKSGANAETQSAPANYLSTSISSEGYSL
jgi:hypothetical protein